MMFDPNVPSLPELLRNLFTYYPAVVFGSLSGIVIGTAGVIQTLNTLINNKTKATNEFLEKQLTFETQRRIELDRKLNEKMEKPAFQDNDDAPRRLSPVRYIKILAVIGAVLTLVSIPFGRRVRNLIEQYAQSSTMDRNTINSLQSQLDLISSPFGSSELLKVLQAPRESRYRSQIDGHAYDLDRLTSRRFVYKGQEPAVLVGSSTKGLLITSSSGKRFVLIVKSETEAH